MTDSPDKPDTPPPPAAPEPPAAPVAAAPPPEPPAPPPPPAAPDSRQSPEYVQLEAKIDGAWNQRNEPGRFETGKDYNLLYCDKATSTAEARVYADMLDKTPGDTIYSRELAEHHAANDPRAGIIFETPGGKDLSAIDQEIKVAVEAEKISAADAQALKSLQYQNWNSGSGSFADDTAAKPNSASYTANATPGKIFPDTERVRIEPVDNHVSLSNAPLEPDGTPPPQDKIPPHMLDDQGRYHQA